VNLVTRRRLYYALIVFYLIVGAFVVFNAFNIQVWPFNPPPPQTHIPFSILYPPNSQSTPVAGNSNLDKFTGTIIVGLGLKTYGPLVANEPVYTAATGRISPNLSKVASVGVAMVGALPCTGERCYGFTFSTTGVAYGPLLTRGAVDQSSFPIQQVPSEGNLAKFIPLGGNVSTVYFPAPGNYYPELCLAFTNFTNSCQTYPNLIVEVGSQDELTQMAQARVNIALSFALVAFGFVEGMNIIQQRKKP